MALNTLTKLTAIPDPSRISDPEIRRILTAMKSHLDVYQGSTPRAEPLDTVLTQRHLFEAGLIDILRDGRRIHFGGNNPSGILPNTPPLPNMEMPPVPLDLQTFGSLGVILLTWSGLTYGNHAYTEIWRAAVDDLGEAVMIGAAQGHSMMYPDPVGASATYYYWVRFRSQSNVPGLYNATAGTLGQTGNDPAYILSILTDQITSSQLHASLAEPIGQIPTLSSTVDIILENIDDIDNLISLLQSGLTTAQGDILAHDSAITSLQIDYASLSGAISANTGAISALSGTVTTQGGLISASASDISAIYASLEIVQDQLNELSNIPEFDDGNTYVIGDLVVYDDKLYRAIDDMPTPPAPLPTDTDYWELIGDYTSLGEAVSALAGVVSVLESEVAELEIGVSANAGAIIALTGTVSTQGGLISANAGAISGLQISVDSQGDQLSSLVQSNLILQAHVGTPALVPNLVHNGSGELGTVEGWGTGSQFTVDDTDYVTPPYSLKFAGGATRFQNPNYRMPVDLNRSYAIQMYLKTFIDGRPVGVFLACEDDISIAGGNGSTLRDRGNWWPPRNTTLAAPASSGTSVVQINLPPETWDFNSTNSMMLFNIPPGANPDPSVIATEGHQITNIEDVGGGILEVTLSTTLRESWPAGTLVGNGRRTSTTNSPVIFGGPVVPGTTFTHYSDVQAGPDPFTVLAAGGVRTTFRRGTRYVRVAFSSVQADDTLWLDEIVFRPNSSLSQDIAGNTASIAVNATALSTLAGEVYAEYTIKTQVISGDRLAIAGIGLTASADEPSRIILLANEVAIADPDGEGELLPFVVSGGVVHINNASIVNLTSANIAAGQITGDRITSGTTITAPVIVSGLLANTMPDPTRFMNLAAAAGQSFLRATGGVDILANGNFILGNPAGNRMQWDGTALMVTGLVLASRFLTQTTEEGERIDINPPEHPNQQFYYTSGSNVAARIGVAPSDFAGPATTVVAEFGASNLNLLPLHLRRSGNDTATLAMTNNRGTRYMRPIPLTQNVHIGLGTFNINTTGLGLEFFAGGGPGGAFSIPSPIITAESLHRHFFASRFLPSFAFNQSNAPMLTLSNITTQNLVYGIWIVYLTGTSANLACQINVSDTTTPQWVTVARGGATFGSNQVQPWERYAIVCSLHNHNSFEGFTARIVGSGNAASNARVVRVM